ncbi:MAG: efflux RND transporter periplasmic adaptor subunit [Deltaproteobacteria bacterium]|nr:efflux RND transporter periplasmic adaptor subunit [Deltaproteobacteria bacterium]
MYVYRRNRPRLSVSVVIASGICLILAACGEKKGSNKIGPPPVLVEIAEAIQKDAPYSLHGIGRARALRSVDIKPRVTGLLLKTRIQRGEYVRKGQPLFLIDPAPFKAKVDEAEAKVRGSEAEFEKAEVDLKRFEALFREKTVSPEQFEQRQVAMKTRKFLLQLHQAELETARLNLSYCNIESPLEGKAGDIFVDEGNTVTAYADTLVTIKEIKPIIVEFSLPGKYLQEIREASAGRQLEVQALIPGSDKTEIGHLSLIDNIVNPKTGMIMLQGTFTNETSRLWPGDFVNVRLELGVTKNAVLVTARAVNEGPKGRYIWLVKQDHTVEMRLVTVGRRVEGMDLVVQGLSGGDRVVAEGQIALYPGAKVVTRGQMESTVKAQGQESPADMAASGSGKTGAGNQ